MTSLASVNARRRVMLSIPAMASLQAEELGTLDRLGPGRAGEDGALESGYE